MGKNKTPRPDGMLVEFYAFFQDLIGIDYFRIIEVIVKDGGCPNEMDKRLITMLFKVKYKKNFINWYPIT
jgi:hypothetical protein